MNSQGSNFNPELRFTVVSNVGTLHNIIAPLDAILEAIHAMHEGDKVTMEVQANESDDIISIIVTGIMFTQRGYNVATRVNSNPGQLVTMVYGKRKEVLDWCE